MTNRPPEKMINSHPTDCHSERSEESAFRQGTALAVPFQANGSGASAPEGASSANPQNRPSPRREESLFARAHVPRLAVLLALLAFASAPLVTAQIGYSQRAKEVGTHLKCMCKGCDMSAGLCAHPGGSFSGPCDTAKSELREIDQLLAKGQSEQQIIDAFVAEYGTTVYTEPPKKGFGLVAWLMPVVYAIAGLAIVILVVRKWAVRPRSAAEARTSIHSDVLDRARAQAARETED